MGFINFNSIISIKSPGLKVSLDFTNVNSSIFNYIDANFNSFNSSNFNSDNRVGFSSINCILY